MRMKYEPPTDGAPFEGELMEVEPGGALGIFRKVLTTERHVDAEVGGEAMADVRLGSLATSLPSPSERLNMVALEKECMKPPSAGDSFAEAVPWVLSILVHTCEKIGLDLRCKAQPKGDVFPLPTSMVYLKKMVEAPEHELVIVRGMCCALNSFYGESVENSFYPTKGQGQIVKGLHKEAQVVMGWPERLEETSWKSFFELKTIDYCGDEVLCARPTSWANLAPAMPAEVASVEHYVDHFLEYLLPREVQKGMKPPKVLVHEDDWLEVCTGLLGRGVCTPIHVDDVFRVDGAPVLNGLFGVPKDEEANGIPIHRLIMDLRPCNLVCRALEGDVSTLPSWATMGPLQIMPTEDLIISSEDVRCFFYIFKIPSEWRRLLAFNKVLPRELWPTPHGPYYLASQVLPMGFKNSVSLAQHVHRNIVRRAGLRMSGGLEGSSEIRKDRPFSGSSTLHRVYLDNFDLLEKVDHKTAQLLQGEPSPAILALRAEYEEWGIPRHPKKAVSRALRAEVQGAIIDGEAGVAYPKPVKVYKYVALASLLLQEESCSQKQAQVVAGGLVYISMFRRPMLGCLNHIWQFIESFRGYPPFIKFTIPDEVKLEIARFVCLVPLAKLNFRLLVNGEVTASDASTTGGGLTASTGLTGFGHAAAGAKVRGDLADPSDLMGILTIGLFDGIGALRVAADALGLGVIGHISVEVKKEASRVLESRFPSTIFVDGGVEVVDDEMVRSWAARYSQAAVVLIGAGPPCQGVSGLNANRRGALRDHRSCLFSHVARIRELVQNHFCWAQVRYLAESVMSMDDKDRKVMTASFGDTPVSIDASGVSLARRPRLYWCNWELLPGRGVVLQPPIGSGSTQYRPVELQAQVKPERFLREGCQRTSSTPLPTFTTSRPRDSPGRRPAGLDLLSEDERRAWEQDRYRFPPYQYQQKNLIKEPGGHLRLSDIVEREVIMGFPMNYTFQCMSKQFHGTEAHLDERKTLVGNTWNVTVVTWLLSQLGGQLGLCSFLSPQEAVDVTTPGSSHTVAGLLQRPPLTAPATEGSSLGSRTLVEKLLNLVSLKGEDIMIQAPSEETLRYHRLRASLPAALWKWKTITGWHWRGSPEHINVLEMRPVLTTLRWRVVKRKTFNSKFIHMIDSLVCLHSLSRGRSSSRKMRRTLCRIDALLLASGNHGVWAYVHTSQNPADRPSRRPVRKKW